MRSPECIPPSQHAIIHMIPRTQFNGYVIDFTLWAVRDSEHPSYSYVLMANVNIWITRAEMA